MTRKDFDLVAEIVAVIGSENRGILLEQARIASEYLERANERFDRERFCGAVIAKRRAIEQVLEGRK